MYNEDEQHSTTGDNQPDEVQILIDQRMAYLIEREREKRPTWLSQNQMQAIECVSKTMDLVESKNCSEELTTKMIKESALLKNIQNKNTGYE